MYMFDCYPKHIKLYLIVLEFAEVHRFGDYEYIDSNERMSYTEAEQYCASRNSSLAWITSRAEDDFLGQFVLNDFNEN